MSSINKFWRDQLLEAFIIADKFVELKYTDSEFPSENQLCKAEILPVKLKISISDGKQPSKPFNYIAPVFKNLVHLEIDVENGRAWEPTGEELTTTLPDRITNLREIVYKARRPFNMDHIDKLIEAIFSRVPLPSNLSFLLKIGFFSNHDETIVPLQFNKRINNLDINLCPGAIPQLLRVEKTSYMPNLLNTSLTLIFGADATITYESVFQVLSRNFDKKDATIVKTIKLNGEDSKFALPELGILKNMKSFMFPNNIPVITDVAFSQVGAIDSTGNFTTKPLNPTVLAPLDMTIGRFSPNMPISDMMATILNTASDYSSLEFLSLYGHEYINITELTFIPSVWFEMLTNLKKLELKYVSLSSLSLLLTRINENLEKLEELSLYVKSNDATEQLDISQMLTSIPQKDVPQDESQWEPLLRCKTRNRVGIWNLKSLKNLTLSVERLFVSSTVTKFCLHTLVSYTDLKCIRLVGNIKVDSGVEEIWRSSAVGREIVVVDTFR